MELALETHGLRKEFGNVCAVDGIDLVVPRGSFYGFLGPNGAGKSTTIKCLTGLLRPTAGSFRILGLDPTVDAVAIRRHLGVVPEDLGLFERLTAAETLAFVGQIHGLDRDVLDARARQLLAFLDLARAAGELVTDYSHGMRKKLALAAALLPGPRLLFLPNVLYYLLPKRLRHVEAVPLGEHHVEQDEIERLPSRALEPLLAVARRLDVIALRLEAIGEHELQPGLVLDEQDARFHVVLGWGTSRPSRTRITSCTTGSSIVNWLPLPGSL